MYLDLFSKLCVLLIFLDYHKKHNLHFAIIHLLTLFAVTYVIASLSHTIYQLLWLAGIAPLCLFAILLGGRVLRKRK